MHSTSSTDLLPHPGAASPSLLHPALQSAHLQQLQQLQSHIMRSAELRSSPFLSPQNSLLHSSPALHSQQTGYFPIFGTSGSPFSPPTGTQGKDTKEEEKKTAAKPESSSNVVSSTMDDDDKTAIKVIICRTSPLIKGRGTKSLIGPHPCHPNTQSATHTCCQSLIIFPYA